VGSGTSAGALPITANANDRFQHESADLHRGEPEAAGGF